MTNYPLTNDKLIYQYGGAFEENYIFYKGAFEKKVETGLKTVYGSSSYIDGDSDFLLSNRAKKTAYEIECTFITFFKSNYERNFINRVFNGSKRITFYYDFKYNPNLNQNTPREFGKVYYHIARTIKQPNQAETQFESMAQVELEDTVILKPDRPYFYDCSDEVEYIDFSNYESNLTYWNSTTWSSSTTYWKIAPASFGLVSALSNSQKLDFFTGLTPDGVNYFLSLRDRFFMRDTSQTARRYIIEETQLPNTTTDYTTEDFLLEASADTDIYRIELSQMATNQSIEILNLTNESGIKITWQDILPSGVLLVYNSFTKKLYETVNEVEIDTNKYTLTIPQASSRPLYFSGLLNPYRIGEPPFEIIRLTNSAGTSLDVKIDILPAYD